MSWLLLQKSSICHYLQLSCWVQNPVLSGRGPLEPKHSRSARVSCRRSQRYNLIILHPVDVTIFNMSSYCHSIKLWFEVQKPIMQGKGSNPLRHYRSFRLNYAPKSTSRGHNLLNFWSFGAVLFENILFLSPLHLIFRGHEQKMQVSVRDKKGSNHRNLIGFVKTEKFITLCSFIRMGRLFFKNAHKNFISL